ncbi:MAG: ribonuclease D [Saprospiraceae bacterium]|jgi:ribonuclease D
MFPRSVTKDEIKELPIRRFEGEIILVDKVENAQAAFDEISQEKIIGIDTETKPAFKKGVFHKTALIQIATTKKVFLFRLNKIGFPKALARVLSDPQIEKIGIAVIQDMKELKQQFIPFESREVVDLNILCKNMGFENIGAKNLSAMVLGHNISKRQQTSNWETNELSDAQKYYAATDAWICREIYLKLLAE